MLGNGRLCRPKWNKKINLVMEGTFFIGGGGGPGLRRGGSLVNFLQIGEGQTCTCFILIWGRVTVFLARKKLLHFASILYIQAKLPDKVNLNYLQVSKNLYIKNYLLPTNIIVSLDPCPLSPGVLWFIAFKASRTSHWHFLFLYQTVAKAFLVGTCGPKERIKFSIFSIFALWVREPP